MKLQIGQRVNVDFIVTEKWESKKEIKNGVVRGIFENRIWVGTDDKTTHSDLANGGHFYLSSYKITPL